jgi:hypothetical protein
VSLSSFLLYFTSARLYYSMSALLAGIVEGHVGTVLRAQITYLLDVILMKRSDGDGIGGGGLKDDSESKSGLYDKGQIHPTESLHRIIYQPPHSNSELMTRNSNPPPPQITFAQTQQLPTPQIKILRRQAPANSTSENVVQTAQGKTYAEKEEEYRLARERIFGETGGSGSGSKSSSPVPTPTSRTPPILRGRTPDSARGVPGGGTLNTGGNGVVRQPRGPAEGGGFAGPGGQSTNGFGQFPPGW